MAALLGPRSTDVNDQPRMYQGLAIAGLLNRAVFRRSIKLASKAGASGAAKAGEAPSAGRLRRQVRGDHLPPQENLGD